VEIDDREGGKLRPAESTRTAHGAPERPGEPHQRQVERRAAERERQVLQIDRPARFAAALAREDLGQSGVVVQKRRQIEHGVWRPHQEPEAGSRKNHDRPLHAHGCRA